MTAGSRLLFLLSVCAAVSIPALAEHRPEPAEGPPVKEGGGEADDATDFKPETAKVGAESIEAQLEETREIQDESYVTWHESLLSTIRRANDRLEQRTGLRLGAAYTVLGLWASEHEPGKSGGFAGDLDLFGRWKFGQSWSEVDGTFAFNMRQRHRITGTVPTELGDAVGSLWGATTGFDNSGFGLTQLYFDVSMWNERLNIRFGEIFQDLHFDVATYKSQKLFFANAAFADNPVVPFPDASVGAALQFWMVKDAYIMIGGGDAHGRKLDNGLDPLFGDDLFSGVELGWEPSTGSLAQQYFSVLSWYAPAKRDSSLNDGYGVSLNWEWIPEKPFGVFARYGQSWEQATDTQTMLTAGVVWKNPWNRDLDRLGVAVAWGRPNDLLVDQGQASGKQTVIESFYRFQVTPYFQVTPDLQLILNPSRNFETDSIWVAGLRGRLTL